MDLLKDLRCSRSIIIDNMALAGVAGTSPTQHNTADGLAVRLQVRWRDDRHGLVGIKIDEQDVKKARSRSAKISFALKIC